MNNLMEQAASGNRNAMDMLCVAALERAKDMSRDRGLALTEALVFARLAATDCTTGRVGRLMSVMALLADECADCGVEDEAARLEGEGLLIMNALADTGVEIAGEAIAAGADGSHFSQGALQYARAMERALAPKGE